MKIKARTVVLFLLFVLVILFGSILFLHFTVTPTTDSKRNLSDGDTQLLLEMQNASPVKPIIRTYELEKYQSFSEEKQEKIQKTTMGKIEGDIPCVYLDGAPESLKFSFKKEGEYVKPDDIPEIQITSYPSESEEKEGMRIITGKLLANEKGEYFYTLYRYRTQYEIYFLETNFVQLNYEIAGEKYLSVFSLHTSQPDADFFKNERLETPIPPEK